MTKERLTKEQRQTLETFVQFPQSWGFIAERCDSLSIIECIKAALGEIDRLEKKQPTQA
jgi:hypothetical protein